LQIPIFLQSEFSVLLFRKGLLGAKNKPRNCYDLVKWYEKRTRYSDRQLLDKDKIAGEKDEIYPYNIRRKGNHSRSPHESRLNVPNTSGTQQECRPGYNPQNRYDIICFNARELPSELFEFGAVGWGGWGSLAMEYYQ
jgi:hypothetical protein